MKKVIIHIFIVFLLISLSGTVFSQSEDEALRLYKQGMKALHYGRYHEALSYFNKSLEISRKLNIPEGISLNLKNIGCVYESFGLREKALGYLEDELRIDKKLSNPKETVKTLNNIGEVYYSLG